jgi:hypothetical protein
MVMRKMPPVVVGEQGGPVLVKTMDALIIHHTDTEREYAYDAKPKSSGKLVEALNDAPQRGWIVVDMEKDWAEVFAD